MKSLGKVRLITAFIVLVIICLTLCSCGDKIAMFDSSSNKATGSTSSHSKPKSERIYVPTDDEESEESKESATYPEEFKFTVDSISDDEEAVSSFADLIRLTNMSLKDGFVWAVAIINPVNGLSDNDNEKDYNYVCKIGKDEYAKETTCVFFEMEKDKETEKDKRVEGSERIRVLFQIPKNSDLNNATIIIK